MCCLSPGWFQNKQLSPNDTVTISPRLQIIILSQTSSSKQLYAEYIQRKWKSTCSKMNSPLVLDLKGAFSTVWQWKWAEESKSAFKSASLYYPLNFLLSFPWYVATVGSLHVFKPHESGLSLVCERSRTFSLGLRPEWWHLSAIYVSSWSSHPPP